MRNWSLVVLPKPYEGLASMTEGLSNVRRSKLVRRQKEFPPPWRAQKRSAYSPSAVTLAIVPSPNTHCLRVNLRRS